MGPEQALPARPRAGLQAVQRPRQVHLDRLGDHLILAAVGGGVQQQPGPGSDVQRPSEPLPFRRVVPDEGIVPGRARADVRAPVGEGRAVHFLAEGRGGGDPRAGILYPALASLVLVVADFLDRPVAVPGLHIVLPALRRLQVAALGKVVHPHPGRGILPDGGQAVGVHRLHVVGNRAPKLPEAAPPEHPDDLRAGAALMQPFGDGPGIVAIGAAAEAAEHHLVRVDALRGTRQLQHDPANDVHNAQAKRMVRQSRPLLS